MMVRRRAMAHIPGVAHPSAISTTANLNCESERIPHRFRPTAVLRELGDSERI
jgi:hypothetical protein